MLRHVPAAGVNFREGVHIESEYVFLARDHWLASARLRDEVKELCSFQLTRRPKRRSRGVSLSDGHIQDPPSTAALFSTRALA
jgi:hypothetical protein